jgi:mRNA-degrading endonuclease RelE of RelBE toxin-antitoxin system
LPATEPPAWHIQIRPSALKALARFPRPDRERIVAAIDRLPAGGVRPLTGLPDGWWLRVGEWRVRYQLDVARRVVDVTAVKPGAALTSHRGLGAGGG